MCVLRLFVWKHSFPSFSFFAGEYLRVFVLARVRQRQDAAKMAGQEAAGYAVLGLQYSLCICGLHCIENQEQSLGERPELASPASQLNPLIARPHITAQVGSVALGRSKGTGLNSLEQLRSHRPDILCCQVLVRENRKKNNLVLNVVMLPSSCGISMR